MANLPQLITREQLIKLITDSMLSRLEDVNDLNPGSTLTQIAESVGQVIYRPYADIISMVDALSVDRAVGESLQRLAADANVPIFPALPSSGTVNITDSTLTKVQTTVYSGQAAPVAGSLTVHISDAESFSSPGTVYIGRGTENVEGPLTYLSITPQAGGTYYTINLSPTSPTIKFHNIGESVVMGQKGERSIPSGIIVQTPQGQLSTSISFFTTFPSSIADGETTVNNVPVVCKQFGSIGNIPKGAIQFSLGLSFTASAVNLLPFTNGIDADTDERVRQRIKDYEQLKAKGTSEAIKASSLEVTSPDELKRTTSSSIVNYSDTSAALVFDDGSGYEPIFTGTPLEIVLDEALGGERNLQIRNVPIAQARLRSGTEYPYNIPDSYNLSVSVNGIVTLHQFKSSDFRVATAATAIEVVASINANSNTNFSATTSDGGKRVVIFPKDPTQNNIKVNSLTSNDSNKLLIFPPDTEEYTLRLYKDDELLYQDGVPAQLSTKSKSLWSSGIIPGDTLLYNVDNTQNVLITVTNIDFQKINPISNVSSSESIELWTEVFNSLMPGITASVDGDKIKFNSNKGLNNIAYVEFISGTLRSKIFDVNSALISIGQSSDYTLNRNTSQVGLAAPLLTGSSITAGSKFTRAKLQTTSIPNGVITAGNLWFILDGGAEVIPSGIRGTTEIKFTQAAGIVTLEGRNIITPLVAEGFETVLPGDWILVWTNGTDGLQGNAGFWRIETSKIGTLTFKNAAGTTTGWNSNPPINKLLFTRSLAPIQKVSYTGSSSLVSLQAQIQSKIAGSIVDIIGSKLRISTATLDNSGEILCVSADESASALLIPSGKVVKNTASHIGFNTTSDLYYGVPSFTFDTLSGVNLALSEFNSTLEYTDLSGDEVDYIEFLDQYDISLKSTVPESNKGRRIFVKNYDTSTSTITGSIPEYMSAGSSIPQIGDRFFLRKSYQFDSSDTVNVIIDQDKKTKYYSLPVSRKIIVSSSITPTSASFSANDGQSDLLLNDLNSFNGFDFSDFNVWRKAYYNVQDIPTSLDIKVSSSDFGPSGNSTRFGFLHPTSSSDSALSYSVNVSDTVDIGIKLPVKDIRSPSWNGNSAFIVSVLPGISGEEYATYQYKVGTQPSFVASSNVSINDLAMISGYSDFLSNNKSLSEVITAVAPTSFTVKRKIGSSVNDAIVFDTIDIDGAFSPGFPSGKITVTYPAAHNVSVGDRIGIYDTSASAINPTLRPADGTYFVTEVTGPTIVVPINTSIPGGAVSSATLVGTIFRAYANVAGLSAGDLIKLRNIGASFSNKIYQVFNVGVGFFECTIDNASGTFSIGATSRYDFQSFEADVLFSSSISSVSRSASTVTVTLAAAPPYTPLVGDTVKISGLNIQDWSNVVTYSIGSVIEYNSLLYRSLQNSNLNSQPDITPTFWILTDENLEGVFIVTSVLGLTFTYLYRSTAGLCDATSGTVNKMKASAKLARCIGGGASYLEIVSIGATAQEVIDYAANSLTNIVAVSNIAGGDLNANINVSTENSLPYLTGSITSYRTVKSSRRVTFITATVVPKGSTITISGISGDYNKTYTVLNSTPSGGGSLITCQAEKIASASSSTVVVATYLGSRPFVMFSDGSNSVSTNDLAVNPQFNLKKSWNTAPSIGEELMLIAANKKHLYYFWNRLIVSGIKNVTNVENSKFNEELMISAHKLGSSGSVEIVSGTANSSTVALVGSGKTQSNKLGLINIPIQLRKGIVPNNWLSVNQAIQDKKISTFSDSTVIDVNTATSAAAVTIVSGTGSFINQRSTTIDYTTVFKVERHGIFTAFIKISGSSPSLYTAGVIEGDWVRVSGALPQTWDSAISYAVGTKAKFGISQIRYICIQASTNDQPDISPLFWKSYTDYSANSSYIIGSYSLYSGRLWKALIANNPVSPVTPGTNADVWQKLEFDVGNAGIYRVVRVYGEDSFWVEGTLAEEVTQIFDSSDMTFFDYDSIMPGDILVVSNDVLGQKNIGKYTVLDDTVNGISFFPKTNVLYTTPFTENAVNSPLTNKSEQLFFLSKEPIKLYKKVLSYGPGEGELSNIIVDSPELIERISSSNGAFISLLNKTGFDTDIHYGIDGYQHYKGLMQEVNKVIYGDPAVPILYPGIKAAGANVDIKPALVKKVTMSLSVRIKTGITYTEIQDSVKASVAGYIATLGVGENVSLSNVIATVTNIEGIISVVITSPSFSLGNDLIKVNPDEKALVINSQSDITVTITGS